MWSTVFRAVIFLRTKSHPIWLRNISYIVPLVDLKPFVHVEIHEFLFCYAPFQTGSFQSKIKIETSRKWSVVVIKFYIMFVVSVLVALSLWCDSKTSTRSSFCAVRQTDKTKDKEEQLFFICAFFSSENFANFISYIILPVLRSLDILMRQMSDGQISCKPWMIFKG